LGCKLFHSNDSPYLAHDYHQILPRTASTRMETPHGYTCPIGCINRINVQLGSVLQFSPSCLADITQHDMVEELVVILRLSTSYSSFTVGGDALYHCAVVSSLIFLHAGQFLIIVDYEVSIGRAGPISSSPSCTRSEPYLSPQPRKTVLIRC
jgi:hypothetical protein